MAGHRLPYQNSSGIFIARDPNVPIEKAWPRSKHFE